MILAENAELDVTRYQFIALSSALRKLPMLTLKLNRSLEVSVKLATFDYRQTNFTRTIKLHRAL